MENCVSAIVANIMMLYAFNEFTQLMGKQIYIHTYI